MKSEYWLAYVAPLVATLMGHWFLRRQRNVEAAQAETDVIRSLQKQIRDASSEAQADISKMSDQLQAMALKFSESELKSAAEIAALRIENASLKADVQILRHENEQLKSEVARLSTQVSG